MQKRIRLVVTTPTFLAAAVVFALVLTGVETLGYRSIEGALPHSQAGSTLLVALLSAGNGFILWVLSWRFLALPLKQLTSAAISAPLSRRVELVEVTELAGFMREANDQLSRAHDTDLLTGLFNRNALNADFNAMVAASPIDNAPPVTYLIADCDHFSAVNATYGSSTGDDVIRAIGAVLEQACLGMPNTRCYRVSADEFAVITQGVPMEATRDWALGLADLCAGIDAAHLALTEPISISIGGACTQMPWPENMAALPAQAAAALRRAKKIGNTKAVMFDPLLDFEGLASACNPILHAVTETLSGIRTLTMLYQPVVDCHTSEVEYFEALARIPCSTGSLIPPSVFFPVIEFKRLDVEFDLAVIHAVQLDLITGMLPANVGVSVNLSSPGLLSDRVRNALAALKIKARSRTVILEVTETVLITDMAAACRCLTELRAMGFKTALDDFGSGFSSLQYLNQMPVDIIKFDRSLIVGLDGPNRRLVTAVARATAEEGFKLVAEGVETEEQRAAVVQAGFSNIQGYLFGKPERPPCMLVPSAMAA